MSPGILDDPVPNVLLVVVFQLGVALVLLAAIANATRGYGTLAGLGGYVVGGLTAAWALSALVVQSGVVTTAE